MTEATASIKKPAKINILTKFVMIKTAHKTKNIVTRGIQFLANLASGVNSTKKKFVFIPMYLLPVMMMIEIMLS